MGSRATLRIGTIWDTAGYYDIPREALFLFTEEDFVQEEYERLGPDEIYYRYSYRSTVGRAKAIADARGITLDLCEEVFSLYQEDSAFWKDYVVRCDEHNIFPEISAIDESDRSQVILAIKEQVIKRDQETLSKIGVDASKPRVQIFMDYAAAMMGKGETVLAEVGDFTPWMDMEHYLSSPDHDLPWQIRTAVLTMMRTESLAGSLALMRLMLESAPCQDVVELDHDPVVSARELPPRILDLLVERATKSFQLEQRIYGFLIHDNPAYKRLVRRRLTPLSEDELIHRVLIPLLEKMGYKDIRPIHNHGPGEFGRDVLPFRKYNEFGMSEFLAAQAKAVRIHGRASEKEGNASELLRQACTAFDVPFVDPVDNERKHIDRFLIVTNQEVTAEARTTIENGLERNRKVVFIDGTKLAELCIDYGMGFYILFGDLSLEQ